MEQCLTVHSCITSEFILNELRRQVNEEIQKQVRIYQNRILAFSIGYPYKRTLHNKIVLENNVLIAAFISIRNSVL